MKISVLILIFSYVLLAFIACSPKIERQRAPQANLAPAAEYTPENFASFETRMQNPRILIWPLEINSSNQKLIADVITNARLINELQLSYFGTKDRLQKSYATNSCECALYEICTGQENKMELPVELCEKLESEISHNEEKIPSISQQLESMKTSLIQAQGSWLEPEKSQEDRFHFKISEQSLQTGSWILKEGLSEIVFPAFEAFDALPESQNRSSFFSMKLRDLSGSEIGSAKIEVSSRQSYLHYQGDVEFLLKNRKRKGILIFQQNRRLNLYLQRR